MHPKSLGRWWVAVTATRGRRRQLAGVEGHVYPSPLTSVAAVLCTEPGSTPDGDREELIDRPHAPTTNATMEVKEAMTHTSGRSVRSCRDPSPHSRDRARCRPCKCGRAG